MDIEILSQLNEGKDSSARLFFQSLAGGITTCRSEFGRVFGDKLKPGGKAIFAEFFGTPVELPKD